MNDVDQVACTLTFASGLIAMVDCSRIASYGYDQRVEVRCRHNVCNMCDV